MGLSICLVLCLAVKHKVPTKYSFTFKINTMLIAFVWICDIYIRGIDLWLATK